MPYATIQVHGLPRYMQMLNTSINVLLAEYRKLGLIVPPLPPEESLLYYLLGNPSLFEASEKHLRDFVLLVLNALDITINGEEATIVFTPTSDVFVYDIAWVDASGQTYAALFDLRLAHGTRRVQYTVA